MTMNLGRWTCTVASPYSYLLTLLTSFRCRLIYFFLNFLCIRIAGEVVNTSDSAVLCYSCMATPPAYANVSTTELADHLHSAAFDPASNQTIRLPRINGECRETHVTGQGQFLDTTKFVCQTGACVKLKGVFQGETFIIRECWDRLWERKYDGKWHGCAPVKFLADTHTEICVCSVDLCNAAGGIRKLSPLTFLFTFLLSSVYVLSSISIV